MEIDGDFIHRYNGTKLERVQYKYLQNIVDPNNYEYFHKQIKEQEIQGKLNIMRVSSSSWETNKRRNIDDYTKKMMDILFDTHIDVLDTLMSSLKHGFIDTEEILYSKCNDDFITVYILKIKLSDNTEKYECGVYRFIIEDLLRKGPKSVADDKHLQNEKKGLDVGI